MRQKHGKIYQNGRAGIEALKIPKHSNQINKKDITSIRILPNDKIHLRSN